MPRVKEVRYCELCKEPFHRYNGNTDAKFCSKRCSCKSHHTKEFQSRAGKAGGAVKIKSRGTGRKGRYVKYFGRHQHRVVMEQILGRKLAPGEIVHHKDGDTHNNDPKNLDLLDQSTHIRLHLPRRLSVRKVRHGY